MNVPGRPLAAAGLVAVAASIVVIASTGEPEPDALAVSDTIAASGSGGARPATTTTIAAPALPDRGRHPVLVDIDGWLQSDVTSLEELRGQVVAVQFWTFGCRNCKNTLPHMQQLYADHRDDGFEIVGIHAPEFGFEAEVANIVEAASELGVTWPIALDPTKHTFHSWQDGPSGHWPRIYLLDRDGHIRYDHIGEGRYDEIDAAVDALLAEPA